MRRLTEATWHPPTSQTQISQTQKLSSPGCWTAALLTIAMVCSACQNPSIGNSNESAMSTANDPSASSATSPGEKTGEKTATSLKLKVVTPTTKTAATSPTATKPNIPKTPNVQLVSSPAFQQALDKAESAASISASAQSPEDWQLVMNQWKEAIALMKQVPPNDTNRKTATQEITRMEAGFGRSQEKLDRLKDGKRDSSSIATGPVSEPRRGIYRAAIKYYSGGIPVVDVMFNGRERFEMMVDTGASGTMITEAMAQQLRIKTVGSVEAMTPSGKTQFKVGYIDSMVVGGGTLQSFPVAIGPVALLGHDFFGDCNISIKRDQNVVEFSQCQS